LYLSPSPEGFRSLLRCSRKPPPDASAAAAAVQGTGVEAASLVLV
jgi:hypothetical protein